MSTDEDAYAAQRPLAVEEGIYSEPVGAPATAGPMRAPNEGLIGPQVAVVAPIIGVGFKDSEPVERTIRHKPASRMTIDE
ncbi:MAG: hypothetical protein JXQ73_05740 [Phycisphaerae bacterium]|nr:hypothetical protein [Phycisphaerae bacterium]